MKLIRKYWLWVLICTVACVAGAWLVGAARSVQYTSAASVDVEAAPIPNSLLATVNTSTEKDVASSGLVLNHAAAQLRTTPAKLAQHISVSVPSGANVLAISCTMPDPVAAQRCAAAVTHSYMNFRNDAGQPKAVTNRDPLTVTLVTPAALPAKPSGLALSVLVSLGALTGLLLGIGTAFIRDRADDRVRDRSDLEDCLGEPVLAVVPRNRGAMEAATVFSTAPDSAAAESFRYLRTHIEPLIPAGRSGGSTILVSGSQRREGRSSVACNLAAALAQAGRRVLLVDADLRHPFLADIFGAGSRAGLTELLAGDAALADVTVATGRPGLQLITAGRRTGGSSDALHTASLDRAMTDMRAAADVVVVDSGPVLAVSDPVAIAQHSDLVVQVANVRRTLRSAIRKAAQELRSSGSVTLVGVLTGVPGEITFGRAAASQPTVPEASPKAVPEASPKAVPEASPKAVPEPARTARVAGEVAAREAGAAAPWH